MTPTPTPIITVDNIAVSYGEMPVIERISLTIERGTFVGLIGPNGAGKTSLLMAASGQFRPVSGEIRFEDDDIYDHNLAYKQCIGYVHETPFLYPHLTCIDFLRFVAGVKNVADGDAEKQLADLLSMTGLVDHRDRRTTELSMGMRKKVAIAAAMIGAPQILFLDEALNGIDFESTYRIKQMLRDFVKGGGTVVLATHVLDVIEKTCDRFILLQNGSVVADLDEAEISSHAQQKGSLEQHVMELLDGTADSDR